MAIELSSDLIEEILSWVPATFLERLRYTCKQWKTLIADPRFVNKHLSHMGCREQQFTVFNEVPTSSPTSFPRFSFVGIDFNELNKPSLNSQVFDPLDSPFVFHMVHCDGLLLYVMRFNLLVLNPLLKQIRWIQSSDSLTNLDLHHESDTYGLGYISNQSSSCNDYRMVRFRSASYNYGSFGNSRVEVYGFKSDCWKVVSDQSFDGFEGLPLSSVCLRGTPYWIGYLNGTPFSIQSFDFSKERFEPLLLPPLSIEWEDSLGSLGVFRGDQLSMLRMSCSTCRIQIWVILNQHWSRLMTVAIPQLSTSPTRFTYFIENNNGKLVLSVRHYNSGSVSIYIVGENQECQNLKYYSPMNRITGDCYYVPSLLQVPS